MRKVIFIFFYFILFFNVNFLCAQSLAGVTQVGGALGGGEVFRINSDGSKFIDLRDQFAYTNNPKIATSKDGTVIYGITTGLIPQFFTLNADGTNFKVLYSFDSNFGLGSNLVLASDAVLYGLSKIANESPYLFKINTDGSNFTIVATLSLSLGYFGGLYEAQDGKFYTISAGGGDKGVGSIISISKGGVTSQVYSLNGVYGTSAGPLIQDQNGVFYGAAQGGANAKGQIFKFNPDGTGFTSLHDFDGVNGAFPWAGITFGLDGKLYGTTTGGGANSNGVFYSINVDGSGFTKLYDQIASDGGFSNAALTKDGNGFFYGSSYYGGPNSSGVVFKIKANGSQYQKIYDYGGSIVQANNNLLLGVAAVSGKFGAGNIYSLGFDGSSYKDLHDFGGPDGYGISGVIQGIDSLLYGTTLSGGVNNAGTIFVMNVNGQGFKKLFDLGGMNGINPSGLVQGVDGSLYGTAQQGGYYNSGTIFKIKPDGTGFLKLNDFTSVGAAFPSAPPLIGTDGNLYGVVYGGGTYGAGVVYSCKPDGSNFKNLINFNNTNGAQPYGPLIQDQNGILYGTAAGGGKYSSGVLFSLKTDGTGFLVLHDFNQQTNDGSYPESPPILSKDGHLYGVTLQGGNGGAGTFYTLNTNGSGYSKLYDFSAYSGSNPLGPLIQLADGKFYGVTRSGAGNFAGGIFSINTDGSNYATLYNFPRGTSVGLSNGLTLLKLLAAPVASAASLVTSSGFTASWGTSIGAKGYQLDVSTDNFNSFVAGYNSLVVFSTSQLITGLLPGTSYQYRVRAINSSGSSDNSNVISATTSKLNQTITFPAIADLVLGGPTLTLGATSSSSLAVSYTSVKGRVTISGSIATLVSAGRDTIKASQPGNTIYNSAPLVSQTFCIKPAQPTITISNANTASPILTSSSSSGNQWYINGTAISGATNATIGVTAAGVYTVQSKVDDCLSVVSTNFPVIITEDLKADQEITIAPNPVEDELQVNGINGKVFFSQVFDITGRSSSLELRSNGSSYTGSVQHLNQGLYLLRMLIDTQVIQLKFIKK